jgi:hypothetical protein
MMVERAAYRASVGLGGTMGGQDVLDGHMRVTFQQEMQAT